MRHFVGRSQYVAVAVKDRVPTERKYHHHNQHVPEGLDVFPVP